MESGPSGRGTPGVGSGGVCGRQGADAGGEDADRDALGSVDSADVPDSISLFKGRRFVASVLFEEGSDELTIKFFAAEKAVLDRLVKVCKAHFDRHFGGVRPPEEGTA